MSEYNLFISHSWAYSEEYNKLVRLLNEAPNFSYRNYSVPKEDPIHHASSDKQLKDAIREQMSHASCVLILAGVYSTYSKWINIEIELARHGFSTPKKIIAVDPRGSKRTSSVVEEVADKIVRWNTESTEKVIWKNKDAKPKLCFMGCPHMSLEQLMTWTKKLEEGLKQAGNTKVQIPTVFTAAPGVLEKFAGTEEAKKLKFAASLALKKMTFCFL